MSNKSSKHQAKKALSKPASTSTDKNIRFIVPMPGKLAWYSSPNELTYRKIHIPRDLCGDTPLEDCKVQFLLQREYPID